MRVSDDKSRDLNTWGFASQNPVNLVFLMRAWPSIPVITEPGHSCTVYTTEANGLQHCGQWMRMHSHMYVCLHLFVYTTSDINMGLCRYPNNEIKVIKVNLNKILLMITKKYWEWIWDVSAASDICLLSFVKFCKLEKLTTSYFSEHTLGLFKSILQE